MNLVRTAMLMAFMTALFMAIGFMVGGQTGMLIALAIAAAMNFFSYWRADKMVLKMHKAVEIDPDNAPEFYEIVARLAEAADLPMPAVYMIDSPQPNAFATGRNPENAAVAASSGLLEKLSTEEIAAVMAHELAHIKNRDTLTMTITATLAGAISMIGNFAMFTRGSGSRRTGMLGTIIAIVVAPFAAGLVQMAISRAREYAADRGSAEICGHPEWLASALQQIAGYSKKIRNETAERNPASAHMFIINPLTQNRGDKLFSTHPATENRVAALEALADEWALNEDTSFEESEEAIQEVPPQSAPTKPKKPAKNKKSAKSKGHDWGRGKSEGSDSATGKKNGGIWN